MKKKECSARAMNAAMAVILCCATMLTACSTVWMNEAEQIVAVLIPAATNIIALVAAVQGNDVSAQDLQAVQNAGTQAGADLQLIQSLISQYESAGATAKPGLLSQIQTAITAVQANLNGILPALHIKDAATQGKVAAIVGMALSEVESLAAIVPLVNSNATPQMMAMSVQQAKNREFEGVGAETIHAGGTWRSLMGSCSVPEPTA